MLETAPFDYMDFGHDVGDVVVDGETKSKFGVVSAGPSYLAASLHAGQTVVRSTHTGPTRGQTLETGSFAEPCSEGVARETLGAHRCGSALDAVRPALLALPAAVAEIALPAHQTGIGVDVVALQAIGDVGTLLAQSF